MESKKGMNKRGIIDLALLIVLITSLIFLFGIVDAWTTSVLSSNESKVVNYTAVTGRKVNEDMGHLYNISINHTLGVNNVTNITIFLWGNFNLNEIIYSKTPAGSPNNATGNVTGNTDIFAQTKVSYDSVLNNYVVWNATNVSSWIFPYNKSTIGWFWFNATANTPGNYNITVRVGYNFSTVYNETNITIHINDTTAPNFVNFSNPINQSRGNYSGNLILNVTATDNLYVKTVIFNITNITGGQNTSYTGLNTSTSPNDWTATFDTTTVSDGAYNITALIYDFNGNVNRTVTNISFTVDNTDPTGSISCSPTGLQSGDALTCSCTSADALSGLDSSFGNSYTVNPSTSVSGTFTQTCTFKDLAGNTGTATSNSYTIWGRDSTSGSSTSTTTFTYSKTISQTNTDFSEMKTIQTSSFSGGGLAVKEKVTFKLGSEQHYVGIKALTASSANIEIASTPTQVTLTVGTETKRDLDNDGFYDISVKLNNITNNKADLTINYLHEAVSSTTTSTTTEGEIPTETTTQSKTIPSWVIWVIVGIVVLAVLIGGGFALKKHKKRR